MCYTLDLVGRITPQLRAKDDPNGLAPSRVIEWEIKPSILSAPETSVVRAEPTHSGLHVFQPLFTGGFLLARPPCVEGVPKPSNKAAFAFWV